MDVQQAYKIIGIVFGADFNQCRQAYHNRLEQLQLQLQPFSSPEVRQRAQEQIAILETAWQCLIEHFHAQDSDDNESQSSYSSGPFGPFPAEQAYTRDIFEKIKPYAPAVIVGIIMLILLIVCFSAVLAHNISNKAQLRVIAVPWCNVNIDGKEMGTSGQAEPFTISAGKHHIMFHRNEKKVETHIRVKPKTTTIIKVNLSRENFYVE